VDNTMPAPERWDPMTQVESVLPASDGASVSPAQPSHSNRLTLPPGRGGGGHCHYQWLHHGSQRPTSMAVQCKHRVSNLRGTSTERVDVQMTCLQCPQIPWHQGSITTSTAGVLSMPFYPCALHGRLPASPSRSVRPRALMAALHTLVVKGRFYG
jgi:hypothetical protein